ncbi:MAG: 2-5 ligase [Betaproteobacteria bacterium]|nr:2-5 ligase [Betaproteobacteria bacterium]
MPRLFFALWPDESVRDSLYAVARAAHQSSGGRLMRRDNLHQTLVFIGNVAAERRTEIETAATAIDAKSFKLDFGTTGYWKHNRIIWAAPLATPDALTNLVAALEAGLAQAGIDFDSRPYSPHVTLVRDARVRGSLPAMQFNWPLHDFVLVESGHDSGGVAYRVVARWPLVF